MRTLFRPRIVVPLALVGVLAGGGVAFAAESSATTSTSAAHATHHHRGGRFGGLGRVIHGSGVVETKTGYTTVDEQRGAVTAVSATSLSVKSADGFTATYVLDSATKVRDAGAASTVSALKTGDNVVVVATVSGSTATATHVVVPKAKTKTKTS